MTARIHDPRSSLWGLPVGDPPLLSFNVTEHVTAAQIRRLASEPVLLVPAPGAGKLIRARHLFVEYKAGSVPFVSAGFLRVGASATEAYWTMGEEVDLSGRHASTAVSRPLSFEKPLEALVNQPLVLTATQDERFGRIALFELVSGGTGYAPGDTGRIVSQGGMTDGSYAIGTVDGSGAVLTLLQSGGVFAPGEEYETSPDGEQPGEGSGLTLEVTEIDPIGDGELWVTVDYDEMRVSR